MERFKETPEIFQPISMNVLIHVSFGVIDYLVGVFIKVIVGWQRKAQPPGATFSRIAA